MNVYELNQSLIWKPVLFILSFSFSPINAKNVRFLSNTFFEYFLYIVCWYAGPAGGSSSKIPVSVW